MIAGAKLLVDMPYSNGVTLNGQTIELVENQLIYTAFAEEEFVIMKGTPGSFLSQKLL